MEEPNMQEITLTPAMLIAIHAEMDQLKWPATEVILAPRNGSTVHATLVADWGGRKRLIVNRNGRISPEGGLARQS
jgi:hypothetical protein